MTSIVETIATLAAEESADTAYLVAGAINLYGEAMRRKTGRILYGPADVTALFAMIEMLLVHPEQPPVPMARRAKPTPDEELAILNGLEEQLHPLTVN